MIREGQKMEVAAVTQKRLVNGVEEKEKVSKKKNRAEGNNIAQLRW